LSSVLKYTLNLAGQPASSYAGYLEADGPVGSSGPSGTGTATGLAPAKFDSSGHLKANDATSDYLIAAAVGGSPGHIVPMSLTVMLNGVPVGLVRFDAIETSAGVVDIDVLYLQGKTQPATPEQLASLTNLLGQGSTLIPQMQQTQNTLTPLIPDAQAAAAAKADALAAAAAKPNAQAAAAFLPTLSAASTQASADHALSAQALADSAQSQALLLRTAGIIPWTGGDHTTLPNAAGDYLITRGSEAGQVWTRLTAGGAPTRSIGLESTPLLYGTRAQRLALTISTPAQWAESDGVLMTYIPGTGWRGPNGENIDNPPPPPPPDTGAY